MLCNPILPAIDKLLVTDEQGMFDKLRAASDGGEPWIVYGADVFKGQRRYMLGRIAPDKVKMLPKLAHLYEGDGYARLGELVRKSIPEDPAFITD